jgi:DNA-binding GntR family transcriptional regulator
MAAPLGTVAKVPATERAYRELKRRILDNDLPAGAQVLEQELALSLGMSRTPVREATIRLAEEGLVAIVPRHGLRVLPISADDMREIYELLAELEPAAARMAAERGLSADELADLDAAVADMDRALAADDLDAWAGADERFHKSLVEHAANRRLRAVVETCWDQAHRARMSTLKLRPRPTTSNDDHRAVVAAIRARDAATAERVHRAHRRVNGRMLADLLERLGLVRL